MNLIPCTEFCKHQEDGYCTLKNIEYISGTHSNKCFYYLDKKIKPIKK